MSKKHHILKLETEYYQEVEKGNKRFEIRNNDRDFRVNDIVRFVEVVNKIETNRVSKQFTITYIFIGGKYGLARDYCVFSFK